MIKIFYRANLLIITIILSVACNKQDEWLDEKVNLNDVDGMFEYVVIKNETNINIRSHVKLNKATFTPDDYQNLRAFFDLIVKKHSEQIVFKKKK